MPGDNPSSRSTILETVQNAGSNLLNALRTKETGQGPQPPSPPEMGNGKPGQHEGPSTEPIQQEEAIIAATMSTNAMASMSDGTSSTDDQNNPSNNNPRRAEDGWTKAEIPTGNGTTTIHEERNSPGGSERFDTLKDSKGNVLGTEHETTGIYLQAGGKKGEVHSLITDFPDKHIKQTFTCITSQENFPLTERSDLALSREYKITTTDKIDKSVTTVTKQFNTYHDHSFQITETHEQSSPTSPTTKQERIMVGLSDENGKPQIVRATSTNDGPYEPATSHTDLKSFDAPNEKMITSHLEPLAGEYIPGMLSSQDAIVQDFKITSKFDVQTGGRTITLSKETPNTNGSRDVEKIQVNPDGTAIANYTRTIPHEESITTVNAQSQYDATGQLIESSYTVTEAPFNGPITETSAVTQVGPDGPTTTYKQEEIPSSAEGASIIEPTSAQEKETEPLQPNPLREAPAAANLTPGTSATEQSQPNSSEQSQPTEQNTSQLSSQQIEEAIQQADQLVQQADRLLVTGEGKPATEQNTPPVSSQQIEEAIQQADQLLAPGEGKPATEQNTPQPNDQNKGTPPDLGVEQTFDTQVFIKEMKDRGLKQVRGAKGVTKLTGEIKNQDGAMTRQTIEISKGENNSIRLERDIQTLGADNKTVIKEEHISANYDKDRKVQTASHQTVEPITPDQRITTIINRNSDSAIQQTQFTENKVPGENNWTNVERATITYNKEGLVSSEEIIRTTQDGKGVVNTERAHSQYDAGGQLTASEYQVTEQYPDSYSRDTSVIFHPGDTTTYEQIEGKNVNENHWVGTKATITYDKDGGRTATLEQAKKDRTTAGEWGQIEFAPGGVPESNTFVSAHIDFDERIAGASVIWATQASQDVIASIQNQNTLLQNLVGQTEEQNGQTEEQNGQNKPKTETSAATPETEAKPVEASTPTPETEAKSPDLGIAQTFDRDKFIADAQDKGFSVSTDQATGVTTLTGETTDASGIKATHTIELSKGEGDSQKLTHNMIMTKSDGTVTEEERINAIYNTKGELLTSNREVIDTSAPDQKIRTFISRDENGIITQRQQIDNKVPGTNEWKNVEGATTTYNKEGNVTDAAEEVTPASTNPRREASAAENTATPENNPETNPANRLIPRVSETFDQKEFVKEMKDRGLKQVRGPKGVTKLTGEIKNQNGVMTRQAIEISRGENNSIRLERDIQTLGADNKAVIKEEHISANYGKDGKLQTASHQTIDTSNPDQRTTTIIERDKEENITKKEQIDKRDPGTNNWERGPQTIISYDKDGNIIPSKLEPVVHNGREQGDGGTKIPTEYGPITASSGNVSVGRDVKVGWGGTAVFGPQIHVTGRGGGEGGRRRDSVPFLMLGLINNTGQLGKDIANGAERMAATATHP